MANEYLVRTPTSTGNRRTFTWAGWVKRLNPGQRDWIFNTRNQAGTGDFFAFDFLASGDNDVLRVNDSANTDDTNLKSTHSRRDPSWMHLVLSVDTTKGVESDRVNIYVNGVQVSNYTVGNYPTQNALMMVNSLNGMNIGTAIDGSGNPIHSFDGEMFDIFFIDGQALTPDVFGFYKEGKGYQSSGTTQATDFRPGQWSPHSPRTIKNAINRTGGFGVNGFYLPMNDSSNFGADFHTTPNSIIKLKGEDLPQPRNGAPTTSDAYVSQLRSDSYASNLVLAVPGISTATGSNLISNGTFDTDTTGWTISDATEGSMAVVNGQLVLTNNDTSDPPVYAWQEITTVSGKRYTLTVDIVGGTSASQAVYVNDSSSFGTAYGQVNDNDGVGTKRLSFEAAGTSVYILCRVNANQAATSIFDNVVVKQEDAPRDYSADIKGSGTNKTLTANGNAGVGYEIPSYYGSALSFDGSGDYLETTLSAFGTNDFTIEYWIAPNSISGSYVGTVRLQATTTAKRVEQAFQNSTLQIYTDTGAWRDTGFAPPTNQWTHIALEKYNGYLTLYANGVAVWTVTNTVDYDESFNVDIGSHVNSLNGYMQDVRVYSGVAKYKGGFDVPKLFTPVGFEGESWRQTSNTYKSNFATMNPLASTATHTNGNLTVQPSNSVNYSASISNLMVNSGKWYCELRYDEESTGLIISGISELENLGFRDIYGGTNFFGQSIDTNDTAGVRFEPTANDGDIISMYMDLDSSPITCSFTVNGGSATTYNSNDLSYNYNNLIPGRTYGFVAADAQSGVTGIQATFNFGQNPTFSGQTTAGTYTDANGKGLFKYQPPAGYLALCEDNLPTPAIADPGEHFKTLLYEGDGTSGRSINVGFKPDLIWLKNRSGTNWHLWYDSVRGPGNSLYSNQFNDEDYYESLLSFDSNGFSVSHNSNVNSLNTSGGDIVAWCWKAGGPAVTNNDGSVASQISVNQVAGFSVVSWTSDGTSLTVGHGLNKVPSLIIQKQRDADANWTVYHKDLAATEIVELNTDGEKQTSSDFANTRPTSSVLSSFTTGVSGRRVIAYCWAEIPGYSKIGSYRGSGTTDGPYVQCGFKPAWVMVKNIDDTGGRDWGIQDSSRAPSNPCNKHLKANQGEVENSGLADSTFQIDMLSNGFKVRNNTGIWNNSGETIIFMAFAESPFQTANAK